MAKRLYNTVRELDKWNHLDSNKLGIKKVPTNKTKILYYFVPQGKNTHAQVKRQAWSPNQVHYISMEYV
jgi:hypothetical protein